MLAWRLDRIKSQIINGIQRMEKIKAYFRESVGLLASVVVLTAGVYLFSDYYFSSQGGIMSYVLYFLSSVSFFVMAVIAFSLIASDAMKTYAEMNSKKMKLLLALIVFVNAFGFIGTLVISVKNVGDATKYIVAPPEPIPLALTADCQLPEIPDGMTYGDAVLLLTDAMKSIADCNHDKRAIRKIEAERQKK